MSKKITEMCSHCGKETEISIKGGKCKYCGHYILPCSQCDMDKVDCNKCPYKKNKEKTYICVFDRQYGHFGMYRRYTIEEWRKQAMEWAEQDCWENIEEEFGSIKNENLIDYISEIWDIQLEEFDEDNIEIQEYFSRELDSLKEQPLDFREDEKEFILLNAKELGIMEEKEMDLVELEQREKKLESVISNNHKELKRVKEKIKEMKENYNFEAIVILKSNVMGKEITELQNEVDRIIKDMKTIDHIGMRKLAYDVKGNKEGYYIKYEFKATKNDRNNLEMLFRTNDTIIKFMTLILD